MSDKQKDVLIAAYLFEDLAKKDFDAVLKLAEDKTITVEGVVLVQKDADGEVHVTETGDHLGRKGAKMRRRRGSRRRPVRAAAAGRDRGRSGRRRRDRASSPSTGSRAGSARRWTTRSPTGSAALIAIYDSDGADAVEKALANAVKKSVAQIDGTSAKELKAGLAEASAGMGGG